MPQRRERAVLGDVTHEGAQALTPFFDDGPQTFGQGVAPVSASREHMHEHGGFQETFLHVLEGQSTLTLPQRHQVVAGAQHAVEVAEVCLWVRGEGVFN